MAIEDLFNDLANLLNKASLKDGMVIVDYACALGRYTIPAPELVGPNGKYMLWTVSR